MRYFTLLAAMVLSLAACAGRPGGGVPEPSADPIFCKPGPECDGKWSKALGWVLQNSAYKIQTQTADLIQTYGPLPNDPRPAFVIAKLLQTPNQAVITLDGRCDNIFGCTPPIDQARVSFANSLNAK